MSTDVAVQGLTTTLLIAEKTYTISGLVPKWTPARSTFRTKRGRLKVNGPFPGDGGADKLLVLTLDIDFDRILDPRVPGPTVGTIEDLEVLRATLGFVDVCYWRRIAEVFSGDGQNQNFFLRRRTALEHATILPDNAATDFPHKLVVDKVDRTTDLSLGTPDADGNEPFQIAGAAPDDGEANVVLHHAPLLRMTVADDQSIYGPGHLEGRHLVLEEG